MFLWGFTDSEKRIVRAAKPFRHLRPEINSTGLNGTKLMMGEIPVYLPDTNYDSIKVNRKLGWNLFPIGHANDE